MIYAELLCTIMRNACGEIIASARCQLVNIRYLMFEKNESLLELQKWEALIFKDF